jgi:4-hydroxybenzoate polyprenyltransferase
MNDSLLRLIAKLYGTPPSKGAPRVARFRWVRRICIASMALYVPIIAVVAIGGNDDWVWLVLAVCVLINLANIAVLTFRIRREDRASPR